MLVETEIYLGPARVVDLRDSKVCVELPDRQVSATMALVGCYAPSRGDIVLAIGADQSWYVIGIIKGAGHMVITAPADLTLMAPHGSINLVSTSCVSIRSPGIRLQADRIELLARALFQRLTNAYTWVKEALQLRTGRMKTNVKEGCHLSADRIVTRARKDVTIDGSSINLG